MREVDEWKGSKMEELLIYNLIVKFPWPGSNIIKGGTNN